VATRKVRADNAISQEQGGVSSYDPVICGLVIDYSLLGATLAEIATLLEISFPTLLVWRDKHPEFRAALLEGKEIADARVAKSLYRRAIGYSHPDTHVCVIDGQVIQTPIVKHYPPDTAAAFIWLQNRRRGDWKHRRPDQDEVTPEQIAIEAQLAIQNAMATSGGA
jgi:hypothetical protein